MCMAANCLELPIQCDNSVPLPRRNQWCTCSTRSKTGCIRTLSVLSRVCTGSSRSVYTKLHWCKYCVNIALQTYNQNLLMSMSVEYFLELLHMLLSRRHHGVHIGVRKTPQMKFVQVQRLANLIHSPVLLFPYVSVWNWGFQVENATIIWIRSIQRMPNLLHPHQYGGQ